MLAEREPVYAQADITLISRDDPHEVVVEDALIALDRLLCGSDAR
jgi:shikimate kinase